MSSFLSMSSCTVIGYTITDESIKDELISTVSYKEVEINSSSFSLGSIGSIIKQSIRESKINSLLDINDNENITHILIDTDKIEYDTTKPLSKAITIKSLVSSIRAYLSIENKYKLILLSSLYRGYNTNELNLKSGSGILYECDLAYYISDKAIRIEKNRYGKSNIIVKI